MLNQDDMLGKLGFAEDIVRKIIGKQKAPDPFGQRAATVEQGGVAQGGYGATPPASQIPMYAQSPTAMQVPRVAQGQPFKWWEWMAGRRA